MPARGLDSPILLAFLRALAFVGLTESIFFRLLPDPAAASSPTLLSQVHALLNQAGSLTFFLAFFFVMTALITVSYRALRHRIWPAWMNGLIAVCLLCLATLGFSAVAMERGPVFAIAFTLLSLLTMLLVAMHAFATTTSSWVKAFAVTYSAAIICSAAATVTRFTSSLGGLGEILGEVVAGSVFSDGALSAGQLLLTAAAAAAFLAFSDAGLTRGRESSQLNTSKLLGGAAALAFAAGSLLAPPGLALLGPDPGIVTVLLAASALFLGVVTAGANLFHPERKLLGYGLLLLVLAGFPLRIAYQHLLMVLGASLVFAPVEERPPLRVAGFMPPASEPSPPRLDGRAEPLGALPSPTSEAPDRPGLSSRS